jgi:hypothetical protein
MEDVDLSESLEKPTEPPERVVLVENNTKAPNRISLDSIIPCLPPEGQDWLDSLNRYCRRVLEHDLRFAGPELFVENWEYLRDTLQKLEREFGPSDNWSDTDPRKCFRLTRHVHDAIEVETLSAAVVRHVSFSRGTGSLWRFLWRNFRRAVLLTSFAKQDVSRA